MFDASVRKVGVIRMKKQRPNLALAVAMSWPQVGAATSPVQRVASGAERCPIVSGADNLA